MSASLVVLDIGATLMTGPEQGPGPRLAAALGLSRSDTPSLTRTLMTSDFATPGDVCAVLADRFGRPEAETRTPVRDLWSAQEHEGEPLPGVHRFVERMAARGHGLGVLSNIWSPYLRSALGHFDGLFGRHVPRPLQMYSCREGAAKPDRVLFERMLDRAGVAASNAVMVGDSWKKDIVPAAAVGMQTLWLTADTATVDTGGSTPTWTLRSLADADDEWFARFPRPGPRADRSLLP